MWVNARSFEGGATTRARLIGSLAAILMAAISTQGARADLVTPYQMGNWQFNNADANGTVGNNPTGVGQMVNGPATPPLGTGSANLATGNGTTGGDGAEILSNSGYSGVLLSALTTLSYSTYVTTNNGSQFPFLQLEIMYGTDSYDQLNFEPPYQTTSTGNPNLPNQSVTAYNTWQTWDALDGGWWDNNGICGSPGTGVASLSTCEADLSNATIVNSFGTPGVLDGVGGVQFDVGFASSTDQFNGYVDAVSIGVNGNTTTYDFELVPEPASIAIFGTALIGLGASRRRLFRR